MRRQLKKKHVDHSMKSRKEKRKQKRLEKKARKHQYYMKKSTLLNQSSEVNLVKDVKKEKAVKVKEPKLKQSTERQFLPKKALTVEDVRRLRMKEALAEDEKIIHRLEKQLKFRNKKKKIPKSFYDEGLGYLLEVIDQPEEKISEKKELYDKLNEIKKSRSERHPSENKESDSEEPMEIISNTAKSTSQINREENDSNNNEVTDENDNIDEVAETENGNNDEEKKSACKDTCDFVDNIDRTKEKHVHWEDIYGRLRDKKGNIIKQESFNSDQKYLPPAKRIASTMQNVQKQELLRQIHRQLKGLLNRLSEANIQPIASEIEGIYSKHSRNDVNETISSLVLNSIVSPAQTPERLIMEHAMLIALLHANVGEEIGAHFLQVIVTKLEELLNNGNYYGEGKMCDNTICLISHIYSFRVTSSVLMYDILQKLCNSFQEKDIELILLILRSVGFALRKDDPITLKQLILDIQKKAAELQLQQDQTRVQFMLETLIAIRNNNMFKIRNYDPSLSEHMKKLLRSLIHKGHSIQEMRISYNDFLKAEKGGGRWWIVGSAWNKEETQQDVASASQIPMDTNECSEDLLKLAKTYRMNTDIRKNIFCIIASAEDYLDAFNRLMHLGLKSLQYREIVIVILDCCLQEHTFNPYYAVLTEKFCKCDRKYRMAFQCAVWDKIKYVNEILQSQRNNLADLLVHCLISGSLNITVLKVMSFADLEVKMMKFLRRIFRKLLLHHSEEECQQIFKKIPKDQKTFKESIRLFIIMFLDDKKDMLQSKLALLQTKNKEF